MENSKPPLSSFRGAGQRPFGPSGGKGEGRGTRVASLTDLDLRPGAILFGKWRVERELGRGGFGVVVEAERLSLKKRQAVKVLDPAMAMRDDLLERFRREVNATQELVHPRIVRVFDYDEDLAGGLAAFSMELVRGSSVQGLLSAARASGEAVPVPLVLTILSQVLEALEAAHAQGVVHRDVTPANILLAGGTAEELLADPTRDPQVKLVDVGIAGALERSELSQKSRVLGTAAYVAPEVLDPRVDVVTPAADVFGAGAVFYEMLTREAPLGVFEPPSNIRAELDKEIDAFVLSLLHRQPARRPTAKAARQVALEAVTGTHRQKQEEERQEDAGRREEERRRKQEDPLAKERRLEEERQRRARATEEAKVRKAAERAAAAAEARAETARKNEEARRTAEERRMEGERVREAEARTRAAQVKAAEGRERNEARLQEEGFREISQSHPWYPKTLHASQIAEADRLGLPIAIEDTVTGIAMVLLPGGSSTNRSKPCR